ncbi:MAG: hypothetical protein GX894_07850 [Clostridia bacterium]|nr:hypothetical protein [Clostridia bacterium]
MGLQEIQKWITLLALSSMGQDKPDELITHSVIRARFGELIASIIGLQNRSSEFFLMGLLSLIQPAQGERRKDSPVFPPSGPMGKPVICFGFQ